MAAALLPKVSFIIPTLNAAPFLERCLTAIRGQDYPAKKIEIIVADAYSTDSTRAIAKKHGATIIDNPSILHEPGKTLATTRAGGDLLFYTDADNILADNQWLNHMVAPYLDHPEILGLLPQTTAPPDSSGLNRYLGYLFTDPLTWFIYGHAANPHDYKKRYQPKVETPAYQIYQFSPHDHPLFGLSQGVGVARAFQRGGAGQADDIISGIQLIATGGKIAYVPAAYLYHYHVGGLGDFIRKYRWRIRNNLRQTVVGMGMVNRLNYYDRQKKWRLALFLPYALTFVLPLVDSIRLAAKWRDPVMFWHLPASCILALLIINEGLGRTFGLTRNLGRYGQ